MNHDTEVETPVFEYESTESQEQDSGADSDSENQETPDGVLAKLFETKKLHKEFQAAIENYKQKMLANPMCELIIDKYMGPVMQSILQKRLVESRKFESSDDIQAYIQEVHVALINIKL